MALHGNSNCIFDIKDKKHTTKRWQQQDPMLRKLNFHGGTVANNDKKFTCVILPNRVADDDLRRCGAIPAAPLAFSVHWSSKRRVDALDSQ